jgi:hypothetical protein
MHALFLAALSALAAVDAPVTEVTVFSDRARVTRTATVELAGTKAIELSPLPDTVDASSLKVEVSGGKLLRVDIAPLRPEQMPADQAKALLDKLAQLDDQIRLATEQAQTYRAEASTLSQIAPATPQPELLRAPRKLEPGGWMQAMDFITLRELKAQAAARKLDEKLKVLGRQREKIAGEARLAGGAVRHGGWKVTATVSGSGRASVKVTYLAGPARWIPSYDLQLQPSTGKVRVSFSGLVSQETTEDWTDARLTLSTAIPDRAVKMPELSSWKIGEKDRFIPTPYAAPPTIAPVPPPEPPLPKVDEAAMWRQRLLARASGAVDQRGIAQTESYGRATGMGVLGGVASGSLNAPATAKSYAPPPPPPMPIQRPMPKRRAPKPQYSPPPGAPAAMPPAELEEEAPKAEADSYGAALDEVRATKPSTPSAAFNLAPPSVWVPPTYAPNLPASEAGGYDLAWSSLAPETVESGKGAREVALFSQDWPVTVERKLFPALAKDAFLVAELKSPSSTPLPGGEAQLFVGNDPAGHAKLSLVSPGEKFTLPLGLDRALRPERNVELLSAEKGFISKDDVSRYQVTTELANPYPIPIAVKIFDQYPLTDDEHVEVALVSTKPWAKQDKDEGKLEWDLTLPPAKKTTVSFIYTIRRPKNWRLHQKQ